MKCDNCGRQMNYCFYIDDRFWIKVVGKENFKKNVGRWCPHCVLEKLGGKEWYIIWDEPREKSTKSKAR